VTSSKSHSRRDDHGNEKQSRSINRHHHSPDKSTRRYRASSRLRIRPYMSPVRKQRRRFDSNIFQGELRNIMPPNFNGEHRKGEETKAWLLEMKKYFQLNDYSLRVETRIATYHLQGKETMWWDQLKKVVSLIYLHK
jgi:hypothetical protein